MGTVALSKWLFVGRDLSFGGFRDFDSSKYLWLGLVWVKPYYYGRIFNLDVLCILYITELYIVIFLNCGYVAFYEFFNYYVVCREWI